jgi:hypothetical protein
LSAKGTLEFGSHTVQVVPHVTIIKLSTEHTEEAPGIKLVCGVFNLISVDSGGIFSSENGEDITLNCLGARSMDMLP